MEVCVGDGGGVCRGYWRCVGDGGGACRAVLRRNTISI